MVCVSHMGSALGRISMQKGSDQCTSQTDKVMSIAGLWVDMNLWESKLVNGLWVTVEIIWCSRQNMYRNLIQYNTSFGVQKRVVPESELLFCS